MLMTSGLNAQSTFQKHYGGEGTQQGYCGIQTADGGYLAVGVTQMEGLDADVYLVKTDEKGDTLWTKSYGGSGHEYGRWVQEIADTGYIIAGYTNSYGSGGYDVYVIKTDLNGDTLWTETYGGVNDDRAYSVIVVDDGYVVTGNTKPSTFSIVYLLKIDKSSGTIIWEQEFGTSYSSGWKTRQTSDGGLITSGYHYVWSDAQQMNVSGGYLIKTLSNGTLVWDEKYEGWALSLVDVQELNSGEFIAAGADDTQGALLKTKSDGTLAWLKYPVPSIMHGFYSLLVENDTTYILTGTAYDSGLIVCETDSSGNKQISLTYDYPDTDEGWSIVGVNGNGYLITGHGEIVSKGDQMLLMKIDTGFCVILKNLK